MARRADRHAPTPPVAFDVHAAARAVFAEAGLSLDLLVTRFSLQQLATLSAQASEGYASQLRDASPEMWDQLTTAYLAGQTSAMTQGLVCGEQVIKGWQAEQLALVEAERVAGGVDDGAADRLRHNLVHDTIDATGKLDAAPTVGTH